MKRFVVLAGLLAGMQGQAGLALEPAEAGRQARDDLDALLEKQRRARDGAAAKPDTTKPETIKPETADSETAKPKGAPEPTSAPARKGRQAPAAIESKVPTICVGCGAK